jgi:hypothetical protein
MRKTKHLPKNSVSHGWKIIHVKGTASERGFQHGSRLAEELKKLVDALPTLIMAEFGVSLDEYVDTCVRIAKPAFQRCKEWADELSAISEGALSKGVLISEDLLLAWNLFLSMPAFFPKKVADRRTERCSAFIATGDATTNSQIVMAHNTHSDFILAPFSNIIMHVEPPKGKGHAFVMQTGPGLLCSSMDWFLSKSGIIGCETTIAGFTEKPEFGIPYFCRIRECMQYGDSLDDYKRIMMRENAGDYACGWLFGDTKTGEIMLLELGLHHFGCERTNNGVFYGSNGVHDYQLREAETKAEGGIHDLKSSVGARNARLSYLLREEYYGRIDINVAKLIIGDHYDVYLGREKAGTRSICKHAERSENRPAGAIDAKVVDSMLAKKMRFLGIWGSACGKRVFRPKAFTRRVQRYKRIETFLPEFRREPWTRL